MAQLVVTAVGPDRPGLVGEFTGHVYAAGCNLADSRMVNLRGQFALLALVEGSEGALEALKRTLPEASKQSGLSVGFAAGSEARQPAAGLPFVLKTYSMDQPGIVHRISDMLRRHGINIEDLETRLESAPFMGAPVFTMEVRMSVPPAVQVKSLRGELGTLCDALNCDFDLEPG